MFTLPEVKLLMDAVESSKFITAKKSSVLANKLSQMTSVYQSEGLKRNAFIEKIWVSKDEFRWYLRSGNGSSDEFDIDDHIKIASFTLTIKDAKEYLYSFSTRRRVYNWKDLNVSVWI